MNPLLVIMLTGVVVSTPALIWWALELRAARRDWYLMFGKRDDE